MAIIKSQYSSILIPPCFTADNSPRALIASRLESSAVTRQFEYEGVPGCDDGYLRSNSWVGLGVDYPSVDLI